jgi:monofunctional biosynthetic peptidoglycan transglycosylase
MLIHSIFYQKVLSGAKRFLLFLFLSSFIYAILCKWFFPPITITQMKGALQFKSVKKNYVSWNDISYTVKLAAIASEDQLFVLHYGFDWNSIGMSIYKSNSFGSGASTITQQVAKNVFLFQGSGKVKFLRKCEESYFTLLIELLWSKKLILETYLNIVEMGPGIFGIEAAAHEYFHKSAKDLSYEEAAMIIACLPNPKKLSPFCEAVKLKFPAIISYMNEIERKPDIFKLITMHDE